MLEQPGETLTAQVSVIPVAATRLSYNLSGSGLEAFHLHTGVSINIHVDRGVLDQLFGLDLSHFFCRLTPNFLAVV